LSRWAEKAGSKRCRKCAANTPAERARRSRASRQLYIDRPELRAQYREAVKAIQTSECRAKANDRWLHSVRLTRFQGIAVERWPIYLYLRTRKIGRKNISPAQARAIIDGPQQRRKGRQPVAWTPAMDAMLFELCFQPGVPLEEIADRIGVDVQVARQRRNKLRLPRNKRGGQPGLPRPRWRAMPKRNKARGQNDVLPIPRSDLCRKARPSEAQAMVRPDGQ
jgi:hypothetical protein